MKESDVGDEQQVTPSEGTEVPATAGTPQEQPSSPAPDLSTLLARMSKLEDTVTNVQRTVSPDAIAEHVVKHPKFKQQQKDAIDNRVKLRTQELFDALSAPMLEELAASGADARTISAQKKAALEQARQMAQAEMQTPETPEGPQAPARDYGREAMEIMQGYGLAWGDFPEFLNRPTVSIEEIRQAAPRRAAEKAFAAIEEERKKKWMKDWESKAKDAADSVPAIKPPPGGSPPADNPIKDIEDSTTLYRLAADQMLKGEGK